MPLRAKGEFLLPVISQMRMILILIRAAPMRRSSYDMKFLVWALRPGAPKCQCENEVRKLRGCASITQRLTNVKYFLRRGIKYILSGVYINS